MSEASTVGWNASSRPVRGGESPSVMEAEPGTSVVARTWQVTREVTVALDEYLAGRPFTAWPRT